MVLAGGHGWVRTVETFRRPQGTVPSRESKGQGWADECGRKDILRDNTGFGGGGQSGLLGLLNMRRKLGSADPWPCCLTICSEVAFQLLF